MPRKKQKPSNFQTNKELLILWARVLQAQQLWIMQILQSVGVPLLPGFIGSTVESIRRQLSLEHFNTWLDEGVPRELLDGLLQAILEEQRTRTEIKCRLVGEVVDRLIESKVRAGDTDNLPKEVNQMRSVFMVERVRAKRGLTPADDEDAKSDAFLDVWEELSRQAESILNTPWPLPAAETDFEANLFDRWQTDVLGALKARLSWLFPVLVQPQAVNYLPRSAAMDRIDREKNRTAQKREAAIKFTEFTDMTERELLKHRGHSTEDKFIEARREQEICVRADKVSKEMGKAVRLFLQGYSQKEAAEISDVPTSTLNDLVIKLRQNIKTEC